jgi:hypothetical protein
MDVSFVQWFMIEEEVFSSATKESTSSLSSSKQSMCPIRNILDSGTAYFKAAGFYEYKK